MTVRTNFNRLLVLIVCFLFLTFASACSKDVTSMEDTTSTPNLNFFGEPSLVPQIFGPDFICTEENFEFAGTFTPDYQSYFFTRRAIEGTNRIYYTEYVNGNWTEPVLSPISEDVDEFEPFITPDGKTIYFGSKRDGRSEYAMYQSEYVDGMWQTPIYSENGLNQGFSMYVSVSLAGNIYFTGSYSINVIRNVEGVYQTRVSTGISGRHPYIAPDESYMLFDVGSGSASYIYISVNHNGVWSTPVKLGSDVNQVGAEQICSSVTPDQKYFFFSRYVEGTSNIYWVDASYLEQYLS